MMVLRPFFSYYGAKWRAAKHYTPPVYPTIIEPFAGSACYALRYSKRNVILVEKDPVIAGLWKWLVCVSVKEINGLPEKVECVDDLDVCQQAKTLIGFWMVKGSTMPVSRPYAWARTGNWNDQFWGPEIKARIARQVDWIRHWTIIEGSFDCISHGDEATWFVDPPYEVAGKHYRCNGINYSYLAKWCKSRRGQVIVCEQAGATWLDFEPFRSTKSLKSRHSDEVVFYQPRQLGTLL